MELEVELEVDLGAGVAGGAEAREIPFDPPQNAILGQNGASGPKWPFPPKDFSIPGATFQKRKMFTSPPAASYTIPAFPSGILTKS